MHPQTIRGNVMAVMDVLENDKYLDALFGLLLQQRVEAILRHIGSAQVELWSILAQPRKQSSLVS
jgi:hypothetical protein